MPRLNIFFMSLFIFSCASKIKTPSWVENIQSGEGSLKLDRGKAFFYRSISKNRKSEIVKMCDESIDKSLANFEQEYQLDTKIPYKLEVVYSSENEEYCATTISIKKSDIEIARRHINISKELDAKKEDFMNLVKIEKDEIKEKKNELESLKLTIQAEREKLSRAQADLKHLESNNRSLASRYQSLNDLISSERSKILFNQKLIEQYYFTGMEDQTMARVLKKRRMDFVSSFHSPCQRIYRQDADQASFHGNVVLCWKRVSGSTYNRPAKYMLLGMCYRRDKKCYRRDLN